MNNDQVTGNSAGQAASLAGPGHPAPRFLSMPDPETGTRLDWIRYRLGTGPEPGSAEWHHQQVLGTPGLAEIARQALVARDRLAAGIAARRPRHGIDRMAAGMLLAGETAALEGPVRRTDTQPDRLAEDIMAATGLSWRDLDGLARRDAYMAHCARNTDPEAWAWE